MLLICTKCGAEISKEEAFKVKEEEVCEECFAKYHNPSKPCGHGPGGAEPQ